MPQIINTNIASLNAQRQLDISQSAQDQALQRLSSGLRINSAKDDAAGLAISTRFDSQIRGTSVAIRNAGDAISLAQTAGGALSSVTTSLQRIRELALQSSNSTNTSLDRKALQTEVDQLRSEISNIANKTTFNGKKLLDGSFSNETFQTGANQGDTVKVSIAKLSVDSLGTASTDGISGQASTTALTGTATVSSALVAGDLVINGFAISGSVGSSDTASTAHADSSAIAKAASINAQSSNSGVTATVNATSVAGSSGAVAALSTTATVALNGVAITLSTNTSFSIDQRLNSTAAAINAKSAQTGVVATYTGDQNTGITLSAADGRNITIAGTAIGITAKFGLVSNTAVSSTGNAAALALTSTQDTFVGTVSLTSTNGNDIKVTTNTGNISNAGFEVGTYSGVNSGVVGNATQTTSQEAALVTGDLVINGIAVGPSVATSDNASSTGNDGSAIAKAAAINGVSSQTGVTAVVNANELNSQKITAATTGGSVSINGVSITTNYATGDTVDVKLQNTINAINAKSGQTGVTAQALTSDQFTLVAADGRNIDLATATSIGLVATSTGNITNVGSVTLKGAGKIDLSTNTGNIGNAGFTVGSFGGAQKGTLLSNIDITTAAGAQSAISAIDNAIQTISSNQANLGAIQNRFDNTITNLQATSVNLSAANSRIKDANFAAETAALSKSQVLQQAGISILSQANSLPKQVLSLLR
jgi:flagellin